MGCGASKTHVDLPDTEMEKQLPAKLDEAEQQAQPAPQAKDPAETTPAPHPEASSASGGYVAEQPIIQGAVVYVLGNDACGKEDLCKSLAVEVGGSYLSATVLLRNAVESGSEIGRKLGEMIKQGKIVPASMTTKLLTSAMAQLPAPYLVDGFPKSLDNMTPFEEQVGKCQLALLFELSDELTRERMAKEGKEEDLIQRKLRNFTTQTMPIAQALEKRSLLQRISAEDAASAASEALKHLRTLTGGGGSGEPSSDQPTGGEAAATVAAPIVFCLGGPGAGKTTVCQKLGEKFHAAYYSAGDLLRDEVKKGSEAGRVIAEMIKEGKIVPTQVTIDLFKEALATTPGPYLIEGFPRSVDNLQTFEEQCGSCSALLFLDVTEETMQERCLERGKTSGRTDDTPETIARRARTFRNQSMPVVEALDGRGLLRKIDASGDEAAVFDLACKAFEPFAKS